MRISKVTNINKAKELVRMGHEVIRVSLNQYDVLAFEFEKNDKFFEDWEYIQLHYNELVKKSK